MFAADIGDAVTIATLLHAGAAAGAKSQDGTTAADVAEQAGHEWVAQMIRE